MSDLAFILDELDQLRTKPDGRVYDTDLKPLIKKHRQESGLFTKLWETKNRKAQALALSLVEQPLCTEKIIDSWVCDLNEWSLCDRFTASIIRPTEFARTKPFQWAHREEEYIRRAAFALIAQMAWQKNDFEDELFIRFLPLIEQYADDERLHVKKAVNWALRDIGKRNGSLQKHAIDMALKLQASDNKTKAWVGRHRCKEFMVLQ